MSEVELDLFTDEQLQPEQAAQARKLDPEEDRENWPTIFIDFEDGRPNYAFLGASGTMKDGRPFNHQLQVQRGVDVKVPPSIVNMLRTSKERHGRQVEDPVTGRMVMNHYDKSSEPWRLIEKGAYC